MYIFEFVGHEDSEKMQYLVAFMGQEEISVERTSGEIKSYLELREIEPDEIVYIIPEYLKPKLKTLFLEEGSFYEVAARPRTSAISLFSFDISGSFLKECVYKNASPYTNSAGFDTVIIQEGLRSLVSARRSHIIVKAPAGTVFIKPSKHEYDEFIRASELAIGYSQTQFVAMCLLSQAPVDKQIKRIFIDSNSIAIFAESIIFYWSKFRGTDCRAASYESFGSYKGIEKTKPDSTDDVWVLISASATNSLARKIVEDWGVQHSQVITILSFADVNQDELGNTSLLNIREFSESKGKTTSGASHIKLSVQGENFHPEADRPREVVLKESHSTIAIKNWINKVLETNLVICNAVYDPGIGSQAICIEPEYYLETNSDFTKWVDNLVDWTLPATAVKAFYDPSEKGSLLLVNIINDNLKSKSRRQLEKIKFEDASNTDLKNESVVVLSPVLYQGEKWLRLNRDLRSCDHQGHRLFVAPFVIYESESAFNTFRKSICYRSGPFSYQVITLNTVFVGQIRSENSWKKELEVVKKLDSDFWKARAALLRNPSRGLNGLIGISTQGPDSRLQLTKGFELLKTDKYIVEKVNHQVIYLAISSILQALRESSLSNSADSLQSHVYQHCVISPENLGRFNDPLLHSCFWRAANSREMDYSSSSEISKRFADEILSLADENLKGTCNAIMDLVMGMALKKIQLESSIYINLIAQLIDKYKERDGNFTLLLDHIKSQK